MSNNMDKQSYIDEAEKELLHTYNRFSLVLDHGEGVHLYDTDGNAYLDFAAGIAVCALGYSNEPQKLSQKRHRLKTAAIISKSDTLTTLKLFPDLRQKLHRPGLPLKQKTARKTTKT
jgi:acetylornithine/succinyldiaminopimelate/putrescine aminotransferase